MVGHIFTSIFIRQLQLARASSGNLLQAALFFLLTLVIFHIALGADELQAEVATAVIIVSLLFLLLLNANQLLKDDYKSGTLELIYLASGGTLSLLLAKLLAHSLLHFGVYLLTLPIIVLLVGGQVSVGPLLMVGSLFILLTNLVIIFTHALLIQEKAFSVLQGLLTLPLLIPAVILATLAVQDVVYLWLLVALFLILAPIFIAASSASLKVGLREG
jgi:heme exporter protein CcmB